MTDVHINQQPVELSLKTEKSSPDSGGVALSYRLNGYSEHNGTHSDSNDSDSHVTAHSELNDHEDAYALKVAKRSSRHDSGDSRERHVIDERTVISKFEHLNGDWSEQNRHSRLNGVSVVGTADNTPTTEPPVDYNTKSLTKSSSLDIIEPQMPSNGPDEVVAADRVWTTIRSDAVKLRMEKTGPLAEKPVSMMTLFEDTVRKAPTRPALRYKTGGKWEQYTYEQYFGEVKKAAKGFIKLGLEPYHGVGIVGFNSPEWFISDLAAIYANGFAVGIYTTNTPEACQYVAGNSECNIVVAENKQQLDKILKVWPQLPHLKAIVQFKGELDKAHPNVYTWKQLLEMGRAVPDSELKKKKVPTATLR